MGKKGGSGLSRRLHTVTFLIMEAINIDEEEADWLHSMREEEVEKAKIYVDGPGDVPEGSSVKRGPRGGYYYDDPRPPRMDPNMKNPKDVYNHPEALEYYTARAGENPQEQIKQQLSLHIKHAQSHDEKKYYELMRKELKYPEVVDVRNDNEIMNYLSALPITADIKLKECYRNATQMCLESDGRIGYVEGYYCFTDFPIRLGHAWCTYKKKNGDVVNFDPTLTFSGRGSEITSGAVAHHGKEYTQEEVREYIFSSELYGGMVRYDLIDQIEGAEYEEQKQMFNYPAVGD